MPLEPSIPLTKSAPAALFRTTHWSVVLAAGQPGTDEGRVALETLCTSYWYPLYAWLRRQGSSPHDAEDLTQGFFVHLLGHKALHAVCQEKGRFRSFLLASFKNFLANERDKAGALKRGGGFEFVFLDAESGEARFSREVADSGATPDQAFDRDWAGALLERVLARLRHEHREAERSEAFEQLQVFLTGDPGPAARSRCAARLGLGDSAMKMAILRLRRRFGELLRAEIAHTVSDPKEIEEEIRALFAAVHG